MGKAFVIEEVANGLGQHKQNVFVATYSRFLKYDYLDWPQVWHAIYETQNVTCFDNMVTQVFLALALSKISICLFLLRLSLFKRLKYLLYGLIAFTAISHTTLFFLIIFQCNPINKVWHMDIDGTCFSKETVEKIVIAQGGMTSSKNT